MRAVPHRPVRLYPDLPKRSCPGGLGQETYRNRKRDGTGASSPGKDLDLKLRTLPFEPYTPVYRQLFSIWKAVNEKRRQAGFDLLPGSTLRRASAAFIVPERFRFLAQEILNKFIINLI